MVQLITFLLVVAALVILVLQNLTPVLSLVVLGQPTVTLPLSLWLLVAIATGALCTIIIYQLVPKKRAYRPIGKRLSDPIPGPEPTNRFVDSPNESPSDRVQSPANDKTTGPNPYDSDWENFRAPEQWDDWEQQRSHGVRDMPRPSARDSIGETVRDIESGWGEDDYAESGRYAPRQDAGPDIGWDVGETPRPRTYEEGWLYGNDAQQEPPLPTDEPEEPKPEEGEDVYDANYRVIIPPYDETKDS